VYTGYKEFVYTDNDLSNFYTDPSSLASKFIENEYLLVSDMDGKVVDKYCF